MAALWNSFTFGEQAVFVALAIACVVAAAGWVLAQLVDPFEDVSEADDSRVEDRNPSA